MINKTPIERARNIHFLLRQILVAAVHPRACGEHLFFDAIDFGDAGSSPRVRGTRERPDLSARLRRFIPARAGNTSISSASMSVCTVHPRACGEHIAVSWNSNWSSGSSPRVRGTHARNDRAGQKIRFIPARAGNTRSCLHDGGGDAVHPRACGEHRSFSALGLEMSGSSPRVRGTQSKRLLALCNGRFIPARAGNTAAGASPRLLSSVHPRACGEHNGHCSLFEIKVGSSPRVRGTHFLYYPEITEQFQGSVFYRTKHHKTAYPFTSNSASSTLPFSGKKDTSFIPSISFGILRFAPSVIKS
jgi:hypothetical protein